MIPYGRQNISEADIEAVVKVLRSEFLTQGPTVPAFEQAVSSKVGVRHGVAVNSATSALHIACLALGLGPGDRLWTVPNTFVASANCARYCGAEVDFVDIDSRCWNMSVPRLREKLTRAKKASRLPKVVVPVHFAGQPTEQEQIWELAQEYGFRVLEDASHAIGASRNDEPVGSCRWSDIAVFSFHPVKIITTGEGGIALTNNDELFDRMALLRTHGITRDTKRLREPVPGPWYYEQQYLGFNYRMNDIQAALGLSQLRDLEVFLNKRRELARRYDALLADLPVQPQGQLPGSLSAYHLYPLRIDIKGCLTSRREVFDSLRASGIGVNVHYIPVHTQPYYRDSGFREGDFPEAENYYAEAITLPLFPGLSREHQDYVVKQLRSALEWSPKL